MLKKVIIENKDTISNLTQSLNRANQQIGILHKEKQILVKTTNELKNKLNSLEKSYQEFGELL